MNDGPPPRDAASGPARVLVGVLVVLLVVAGVGIEAWPLTGWRLFSASRDEAQTRWVLEAVDPAGAARIVDLDDLPLAYSTAEWPMADLPAASTDRREAVCQALLEPVLDIEPDLVELHIARDDALLLERGGEWTVVSDLETLHTCTPSDHGGTS